MADGEAEKALTVGDLAVKLPTVEVLNALDDDQLSGRRRMALNYFTIREVRALRALLDSLHPDTKVE
jgi:hypothetical protein